jgi:hypothetical protein
MSRIFEQTVAGSGTGRWTDHFYPLKIFSNRILPPFFKNVILEIFIYCCLNSYDIAAPWVFQKCLLN